MIAVAFNWNDMYEGHYEKRGQGFNRKLARPNTNPIFKIIDRAISLTETGELST